MSSYERRVNERTGEVTHRIRFRHAGGNRSRTFLSEEKARSWQSVLDTLKDPGRALALLDEVQPDTTRTVADQVDHHIKHLTDVTAGTRRRYQKIADLQIRPRFGRTLLGDLTRDMVAEWINDQSARDRRGEAQPASSKTIDNRKGVLSSALNSAVRDGLIPLNPARGVHPRRDDHASDDHIYLTLPEFELLLTLVREHYRPLVTLLGLTGIRWGEATALTAGNIDHATHTARIRQAWKHTDSGAMELGPPKSKKSRRTVAVPEPVFVALAPSMADKRSGDIVLLSPRGNPIRSGTFHNVVWQPAVAELEQRIGKRPRVHDLRHSWASWAIQRNVPLPVIQRQMGHESIETTVDTYGHLARSDFDPLLEIGVASPVAAPALVRALPAGPQPR